LLSTNLSIALIIAPNKKPVYRVGCG